MNVLDQQYRIVIGLGTGRSGTASLTSLIDRQKGGMCFHEMNPACSVFSGNPQPQINAVSEFRQILLGGDRRRLTVDYSRPSSVASYARLQTLPEVRIIGDIAFYYLNYVGEMLEVVPECLFVCLRRERNATVESWLKKSTIGRWPSLLWADRIKSWLTRMPFHSEYNFWQEHDGTVWRKDPVWDSCFPKFDAPNKRAAIEMYWDYYYLEAERLQRLYPKSFRIFDTADMSSPGGQRAILEFIGIPELDMVISEKVHLHQS
ncbi:MAG: hypothetical protein KDI09_13495 [Halioglobus sp.]|nr:hypothetical protein [Halioglobus sp.]